MNMPAAIVNKAIIIGVPALGKVTGGSVSFNFGVTSEVSSTVSPSKSVYEISTLSFVSNIGPTILLSKSSFNFKVY